MPGYSLPEHDGTADGYRKVLEDVVGASKLVLALRSGVSIADPQAGFELGICWTHTSWLVPIVDTRTGDVIAWKMPECGKRATVICEVDAEI